MTEGIVILIFCLILLASIALDLPILYALGAGLLLFLLYGRRKGFSWKALGKMALKGVWTVRNILMTFLLLGVLTAFWRAAGTIPVTVTLASGLIRPEVYLLMTFLLNGAVSVLTGTSFGTAATMGVICASMGHAMGVDVRLIGGAVLAGAFFGDRCSPVSTSALLVSELTGTDIFHNIRRMVRTAAVPFVLSCVFYAALGFTAASEGKTPDLAALFGRAFRLEWPALLPAAAILILAAFRVKVKAAMAVSILTAIPLCLILQGVSVPELLKMAVLGYHSADGELEAMLGGGAIASMLRVAGIVCLSSSYSGIFKETGLLNGIRQLINRLGRKTTDFAAMLVTSAGAGMIACNQTLAVMLTHQLCADKDRDASDIALDLEDSVIVVAPLVPWSIACAVPLAAAGAPPGAVLFAFYLYILPLWRLAGSFLAKRKNTSLKEKKS